MRFIEEDIVKMSVSPPLWENWMSDEYDSTPVSPNSCFKTEEQPSSISVYEVMLKSARLLPSLTTKSGAEMA